MIFTVSKIRGPSKQILGVKIRQSLICYAGLLGQRDKWIVDQASDVPCGIFFRLFIDLVYSKLFNFIFVIFKRNEKKNNWKAFCKVSTYVFSFEIMPPLHESIIRCTDNGAKKVKSCIWTFKPKRFQAVFRLCILGS